MHDDSHGDDDERDDSGPIATYTGAAPRVSAWDRPLAAQPATYAPGMGPALGGMMKIPAVARVLGLGRSTVWRYAESGLIPAVAGPRVRGRRQWSIPREYVQRWRELGRPPEAHEWGPARVA